MLFSVTTRVTDIKKWVLFCLLLPFLMENCAEYCSVRWNRFLNIWMHKDYRSIEIIHLPGLNVGDEVKKKKEAIHQMCFTVQLILNAQFHISVDFLSLQEIGDAFFCHLVCFIFADMCKNRKMTHVLHCDGVLSSPCGTGARYWHDKRNKKMCSPTLYRTGILTTELRVNP